jgi:hypothetical protein
MDTPSRLPSSPRLALFGLVPTALAFLTAWGARRDLVDPAGRERPFRQAAVVLGAGVIDLGIAVVVGVIARGFAL